MKRNQQIKLLLVVAILWILGIFVVQLYTLPQIREQVSIGLRAGLEEINEEIARELSDVYEQTLRSELSMLLPVSTFDAQTLQQQWSHKESRSSLTRMRFLILPDSARKKWMISVYDDIDHRWEENEILENQINSKLSLSYTPWSLEFEDFWENTVDSTLLLFDKVSPFEPTTRFACHPFFDKKPNVFQGFVGLLISEEHLIKTFIPQFFKTYFSSEELARKDGIQKEFLFIQIRDEENRSVYKSSLLAGEKIEAKKPIGELSTYLASFQVEIGFLGKGSAGVADSLHTRNLWLLGSVFGVLLLLMAILYYISLKSQKLDRLKSEFLANIGHELKTPLTAIKLANDTLRHDRIDSPEQAKLSSEIISKEANKLEILIARFMEFSQMELEERVYQKETFDLKDWWEPWISLATEKLTLQGFLLSGDSDPPPGKILADVSAIEEVLEILLDNAVKYSGESRALGIHLNTSPNVLTITVEDQGIGIPKDRLSDIFEKFVRISEADVHDVKGYGLGLSIAKAILEAHEGEIFVRSEPGEGSVFSLCLPLITPLQ